LLVGCEQPSPTIVETEKEETAGPLGFTITNEFAFGQWHRLVVQCHEYPDPLPSVSVNGNECNIDIMAFSGLLWEVWGEGFGSTISYEIRWQSDVLADSFTIPAEIDSLVCNGKTMSVRSPEMPYDTVVVDTAYRFQWYGRGAPYYGINIGYELADGAGRGRLYFVQSEDSLSIPALRDSAQIIGMRFSVLAVLDSVDDLDAGMAGMRSGRLHAYRDIRGGSFETKLWRMGY